MSLFFFVRQIFNVPLHMKIRRTGLTRQTVIECFHYVLKWRNTTLCCTHKRSPASGFVVMHVQGKVHYCYGP